MNRRILNEINHSRFLSGRNTAMAWNRITVAGLHRWARRASLLASGIGPQMQVLEIGCGTGDLTQVLLRQTSQLTAVDISPEFVEIVKERYRDTGIVVKTSDVSHLPFNDHTFDFVTGNSVLHHLEINPALAEIRRVLKPGGMMAFAEPNMLNPHIAIQKNIRWIKRVLGDSPDETAFIRWKLKKNIILAGFRNIVVRPFDFLYPWTPSPFIRPVDHLGSFIEKTPLIREIAGSLYIRAMK